MLVILNTSHPLEFACKQAMGIVLKVPQDMLIASNIEYH